jgi:hypothetical protein
VEAKVEFQGPDKKKKIIAWKGWIIFIAIISLISAIILQFTLQLKCDATPLDLLIMDACNAIAYIVLYSYPAYLFIRFIIWVVRKLREKK